MSFLKSIIIAFTVRLAFFISPKRDECVLFSSHIPVQNLGDQAILLGSIKGLERFSKVHVIQTGSDRPSEAYSAACLSINSALEFHNFDVVFATERSFRELLKLILFCMRYGELFFIGADVLDGTYSRNETARFYKVVKILSGLKRKLVVVGSSFSKNMTTEASEGLKNLDRKVNFFCRDASSLSRVQPLFPAKLSADAGFLMPPSARMTASEPSAPEWGVVRVGVCLKESDAGSNYENFELLLKELSKHWRQFEICFLPHHLRDFHVATGAAAICDRHNRKYFMPESLPTAPMIKRMAKDCNFLVTGRMHVAIAGLGTGVFPVCVAYGDKFEGLYQHFDLDARSFLIDGNFGNLAPVLSNLFYSLDKINQTIDQKLPKVLDLARSNFK